VNGGILVALAGVWLGCQVFGGKALERLGIIGDGVAPADKAGAKKSPSAAKQGQSVGTTVGAIVGSGAGPVGTVIGGGAGAILGNAAGEAVHGAKKIADVIGGWIP
jgi:hypothetical protein